MPEMHLLKVREASARLNVSEDTVRRLVSNGDLTSVRIGRALRIPAHSVDEMIGGPEPAQVAYVTKMIPLEEC